jgi:hypothetical protein
MPLRALDRVFRASAPASCGPRGLLLMAAAVTAPGLVRAVSPILRARRRHFRGRIDAARSNTRRLALAGIPGQTAPRGRGPAANYGLARVA